MWQPNPTQWKIIWIVALMLILGWPPNHGRSLAVKAANWLADPNDALPSNPAPLPIGLDDNGDAVAAHDAQEAEYQSQFASSRITRLRMRLKVAGDPLEPSTQRQMLAGIAILSVLVIWRLKKKT